MKISNLLKDQSLVSRLRGIGDIDEIQISTRSDSRLGKMLSPDWKIPFVHPVFGYFASIQAYWTWLVTKRKDNALRTMYSGSLAKYQHENGFHMLENIQALIAEALLFRLLVSNGLVGALKKQEKARFSVWYIRPTGQKQYTHYSVWYSNMLRDLHEAVKQDSVFDPVKYGYDITDMTDAYDEVFSHMSEEEIQDITMTDPSLSENTGDDDHEHAHLTDEELYASNNGDTDLSEEELADQDDVCARLASHLEISN